jgi:hypothetical protein
MRLSLQPNQRQVFREVHLTLQITNKKSGNGVSHLDSVLVPLATAHASGHVTVSDPVPLGRGSPEHRRH